MEIDIILRLDKMVQAQVTLISKISGYEHSPLNPVTTGEGSYQDSGM